MFDVFRGNDFKTLRINGVTFGAGPDHPADTVKNYAVDSRFYQGKVTWRSIAATNQRVDWVVDNPQTLVFYGADGVMSGIGLSGGALPFYQSTGVRKDIVL